MEEEGDWNVNGQINRLNQLDIRRVLSYENAEQLHWCFVVCYVRKDVFGDSDQSCQYISYCSQEKKSGRQRYFEKHPEFCLCLK